MSGFMKTVLTDVSPFLSLKENDRKIPRNVSLFPPPSYLSFCTHYFTFIIAWSDVYIALEFWNQNKKFTWPKGTHFLFKELRHG